MTLILLILAAFALHQIILRYAVRIVISLGDAALIGVFALGVGAFLFAAAAPGTPGPMDLTITFDR